MIEQLRAEFLPRFRLLAQERLVRIRQATEVADSIRAAGEFHALAGEAAVLGETMLADLARSGEALARRGEPVGSLLEAIARDLASSSTT